MSFDLKIQIRPWSWWYWKFLWIESGL